MAGGVRQYQRAPCPRVLGLGLGSLLENFADKAVLMVGRIREGGVGRVAAPDTPFERCSNLGISRAKH